MSKKPIICLKSELPTSKIRETKPELPKANELSKQRLKKLFNMFCVHASSPRGEVGAQWKDCQSCILHQISWKTQKGKEEGLLTNLCYAYFFEDVLND